MPEAGNEITSEQEVPLMIKQPERGSPDRLKMLQDQLLFRLAYPPGKEDFEQAREALDQMAVLPLVFPDQKKYAGLPGVSVTGSFSYAIVRWLYQRFPETTAIESSAASPASIRLFLSRILPRCEYETIHSGNAGLLKKIAQLKGSVTDSSLGWLITQMENKMQDEREKEHLFDQLQVFIRCQIMDKQLLPMQARVPVTRISYRTQSRSKKNLIQILQRPLPPPTVLSAVQRNQLIDLARTLLLFLYRETDPFTYADHDALKYFELEDGWSVLLYPMQPERRLSLESYIGYLACRNGVPLAYGGGWLFGQRCQFGINIFPAYRGGSSQLLMAQILRVYHQFYGAERFVVKPYQFGWKNPEALRTGAFWFYYKAGFRPEEKECFKLAQQEMKKKKADPQYRSSEQILKAFTRSSLFLQIKPDAFPVYDASLLSRAVTRMIHEKFSGNRQSAIRQAVKKIVGALPVVQYKKWHPLEIRALEEWSLVLYNTVDLESWTTTDKKKLATWIRSRGLGPEEKCIRQIQTIKPFWEIWNRPDFLQQLSY